jgi:hypothetical protein
MAKAMILSPSKRKKKKKKKDWRWNLVGGKKLFPSKKN